MKRAISWLLMFGLLAVQASCSARRHAADVQAGVDGDRMTVGVVQKEIRKGMPGSDVAAALGSPNIVTTDEEGREVWIYDKIATDRVESSGGGGAWLLFFGASSTARASSTSQRTLTIIIKYDANQRVRDVAYHSSRF